MSNRWNKLSSTRFTLAIIAFGVFSLGAAILIFLGKYPQIQTKLIDWAGYVVLAYLGFRTFRGSISWMFSRYNNYEEYDRGEDEE